MSTGPDLPKQIVSLHQALDRASIAHAFGGALALAYCTAEPRGTRDIDVNVFLGLDEVPTLLAALPSAVTVTDADTEQLRRDGQARLWWAETPVDVFLSNHSFHDRAEANRRFVPFAGVARLPVLACEDLAVFKIFFARPKDAVDVATMVIAGSIDLDAIESTVTALLGDDQQRADFFSRVRSDVAQM